MQNTTFFGLSPIHNIIVLESVASTNDYVKDLLSNFKPLQPFTAIMAKEQTQGRGQRGTTWQSSKGENLTASFVYCPDNFHITDQFALTIISSLSVYDVVQQLQPNDVYIKWPNDIFISNKKVAGILIENKLYGEYLKHAIIGVGLNVNQIEFPIEIAYKTTSIVQENFENDVTILDIVRMLQEKLKYYTHIYEHGQEDALLNIYNQRLYRKGILSLFTIRDTQIEGTISAVDKDGLLQVLINQEIRKFDLKEISYVL